jgi:hypothetical protein
MPLRRRALRSAWCGEVDRTLSLSFVPQAHGRARHASSPSVKRGFCSVCGSTLTYEGDRWPSEIHVHIGAFDAPQDFAPKVHAFAEERIPWLHLADI